MQSPKLNDAFIKSTNHFSTINNDFSKFNLDLASPISRESDTKSNKSTKTNQSTQDPEKINLARYYQLVSIIAFIFSCALVKVLVARYDIGSFPQYTYVTVRFFGITLFNLILIKKDKKPVEPLYPVKNVKWIIIRSVTWVLNFLCYSVAVEYLKFGLATLLLMISPIQQNILYSFYFNIRLNMKYIYACLICLFGVLVIFIQTDNQLNVITFWELCFGIINGLIVSTSIAALYISVKVLVDDYESNTINYITSFWSGVISLFLLLVFTPYNIKYVFDIMFLLIMLLIIIFVGLGFYFTNLAVITADIAKSSYMMYLQLPTLALFGMIFYGERYSFGEMIGFGIIIVTSIYTSNYLK